MTRRQLLVDIGMPVYNDEAHVGEAIRCLTAQSYADIRIWISDNASTDQTGAICREVAASDARVMYVRSAQNRGSVWNLNHVFSLGRAPLFMWAASDDRWHPDFVSRCVAALSERSTAVIAHPYQQHMTYEGLPVGDPFTGFENLGRTLRERWLRSVTCWPLHMAYYGVMRREAAARTRLTLLRDSSDFIFIAEMSLQGEIIQVPELLFWKRLGRTAAPTRSNADLWGLIAAGPAPRAFPLMRLSVLLECLRGARRCVPTADYRELAWDTLRSYLSRTTGYLAMDAKEFAGRARG